MTNLKQPAAALIAVLLMSGCIKRDEMSAVQATRNLGYNTPMNTAAFVDPGLERRFTVEQTSAARSATNTLIVKAEVRNRTEADTKLSLRTRFYDAQRQPVEESSWAVLYVAKRGLKTYETSSTRTDAVFYYVEVMEGR
ncbi:MAG: hypothetical protein WEE89_23095 [Gemmatimonadota bacterium]